MTTLARPLSAGRRLEVCSRNVAIYITRDYIVRQTENLAFIFKTVVYQRDSKSPALKVTSLLQRPKKSFFLPSHQKKVLKSLKAPELFR